MVLGLVMMVVSGLPVGIRMAITVTVGVGMRVRTGRSSSSCASARARDLNLNALPGDVCLVEQTHGTLGVTNVVKLDKLMMLFVRGGANLLHITNRAE